MIGFTVDIDYEGVQDQLGSLSNRAEQIMARASKATAKHVRTQIDKEIRARYVKIKQKTIFSTLSILSTSSQNGAFYTVRSKGVHIPLTEFHFGDKRVPRRKKRGGYYPASYWASVLKNSGKETLAGKPKPFFYRMPRGGAGAYVHSKAKGQASAVYGPSIPQMIGSRYIMKRIEASARDMMQKQLEYEIGRKLEKKK